MAIKIENKGLVQGIIGREKLADFCYAVLDNSIYTLRFDQNYNLIRMKRLKINNLIIYVLKQLYRFGGLDMPTKRSIHVF